MKAISETSGDCGAHRIASSQLNETENLAMGKEATSVSKLQGATSYFKVCPTFLDLSKMKV